MKSLKKITAAVLAFCMLLTAGGCGEEEPETKAEYRMYYLAPSETSLATTDYIPTERRTEAMVQEIARKLEEEPESEEYLRLLPKGVEIKEFTYEGQSITINFNDEYKKMKNTREILVRAGVVKAFTQIPGVTYVSFQQEGEPLTDSDGVEIGRMDKTTFVENEGENINSYVNSTMNLYFADQDGNKLVNETVSVYYSSNVPLEREVVERLVKGPKSSDLQPVLSRNTKILGVSIVEGICYVNLDKTFLTETMNVQEKLPVYAIVNSLMDACSIRGVQISVEGETKVTFRESMKLDEVYHADYSLLEEPAEEADASQNEEEMEDE